MRKRGQSLESKVESSYKDRFRGVCLFSANTHTAMDTTTSEVGGVCLSIEVIMPCQIVYMLVLLSTEGTGKIKLKPMIVITTKLGVD